MLPEANHIRYDQIAIVKMAAMKKYWKMKIGISIAQPLIIRDKQN